MRNGSRKLFWLGLILVFFFGLIGGAYLVLRSTVTHGELANSTPASQGKSSDELLAELLKLNQMEEDGEYVPPEDKNLTEEYLGKIVVDGNISQETLTKIESTDFLASTVLPYLASNKPELFPFIPNTVLKIVPDSKTSFQKYFKDTNKDVITFFESVRKMSSLDVEKITDAENMNEFDSRVSLLGTAFENLSKVSIPKKYVELHKNIMVSIFSLQKMYESILKSEEDPLKSLLMFNEAESTGEFWKQSLLDYDNASKGK
jgi:hypothetical protein